MRNAETTVTITLLPTKAKIEARPLQFGNKNSSLFNQFQIDLPILLRQVVNLRHIWTG